MGCMLAFKMFSMFVFVYTVYIMCLAFCPVLCRVLSPVLCPGNIIVRVLPPVSLTYVPRGYNSGGYSTSGAGLSPVSGRDLCPVWLRSPTAVGSGCVIGKSFYTHWSCVLVLTPLTTTFTIMYFITTAHGGQETATIPGTGDAPTLTLGT
jgi:hypothetical protein